jgi:hypothetical protein
VGFANKNARLRNKSKWTVFFARRLRIRYKASRLAYEVHIRNVHKKLATRRDGINHATTRCEVPRCLSRRIESMVKRLQTENRFWGFSCSFGVSTIGQISVVVQVRLVRLSSGDSRT